MGRRRAACARILILVLLVCSLAQAAVAVNRIEAVDVSRLEYTVSSPGLTIPQINVYDLQPGITTLDLDAYGEHYLLTVDCSREGWFDAWWIWDVTLTYPNGTTASEHLKNLAPAAQDYDLYIQYFIGDATWILDADIYVDLLPLNVQYGTPGFIPKNRVFLAFSTVSIDSPNPFGVKLSELTPEEFSKMKAGDLLFMLGETVLNVAKDAFDWTWGGILWFCEKIPVIGPYLAALLELSGAAIGEIVSWGLFILENSEVIIMFAEGLILAEALLSSRSRTLMGLLRRIVDNHVRVVKFALWMLDVAVLFFTRLIDVVAKVVQALKPL